MKTVLIADDHVHIRTALRNLLNSEPGFLVCGEAQNGKEAVEKAEELKPDLIVLDISMPLVNGLEATHAIKKVLPDTPIMLFTAYKTKFSDAWAAAAGANAMVSKTDDLQSVVDRARALLQLETGIEWSCPVCGASGTVDAAPVDPDGQTEAIRAHHHNLSPECPNSGLRLAS
jgi:DNA-binding NarL/FixJ family response regulator